MQDLLRMELSGSRFAQNGSTGHGDGKNLLEGVEAFHFNPDGTVRNQIRSRDAEYDRDSKKAFFPGMFGRGSHAVMSSSLITTCLRCASTETGRIVAFDTPRRFRHRSRCYALTDKPDGAEAKRHERIKFVVIGRHCRAAKTARQRRAKCVREGYRIEDCRILPEGGVGVIAGDHPRHPEDLGGRSAAVTPPRR